MSSAPQNSRTGRWSTLPTQFYLVQALDNEGETFIHETTARSASLTDVAIDLAGGQYDRFPIVRIIGVNLEDGASEDATETVLRETVRLAKMTGAVLPSGLYPLMRECGVMRTAPVEVLEAA